MVGLDICVLTRVHHYSVIQSHCPQMPSAQPVHLSLPQPWATSDLLTVPGVVPLPEGHIVEITKQVAFSN